MRTRLRDGFNLVTTLLFLLGCAAGRAEDDPSKTSIKPSNKPAETKGASGIVRMTKDYDLWIDPKRKLVIVDGEVCLREGQLEMFACPKGTKEHESIVAVNCTPRYIHAALEAVGAKAGQVVQFVPEYRAATGPVVDVFVVWEDERGQRQQARAQQWIKNVRTGKEMKEDWVFAGSGFWVDPETGDRHYMADGGDLICVSNFPSATLDLPIESSQANASLLFAAFTERIPPVGTKVRLVLRPRTRKNAGQDTPSGMEKDAAKEKKPSDPKDEQ